MLACLCKYGYQLLWFILCSFRWMTLILLIWLGLDLPQIGAYEMLFINGKHGKIMWKQGNLAGTNQCKVIISYRSYRMSLKFLTSKGTLEESQVSLFTLAERWNQPKGYITFSLSGGTHLHFSQVLNHLLSFCKCSYSQERYHCSVCLSSWLPFAWYNLLCFSTTSVSGSYSGFLIGFDLW